MLDEAANNEIVFRVPQTEFKLYFIMDTFGLLSPRHLEKVQCCFHNTWAGYAEKNNKIFGYLRRFVYAFVFF